MNYHYVVDADGTRRPALPVVLAHASQGHSMLLVGGFDAGLTSLARAVCNGLPALTSVELERVNMARQAAKLGPADMRPFRAPHYTCSDAALLGTSKSPYGGELHLARHGVLLLDQVVEFRKSVLDKAMVAVKTGRTEYPRADGAVLCAEVYPQVVIGTAPPCSCGKLNSQHGLALCRCSKVDVMAYQNRLEQAAKHFAVRLEISLDWTALVNGEREEASRA